MKKDVLKMYNDLAKHATSYEEFSTYVKSLDNSFSDSEIKTYYEEFKGLNDSDLENITGGGYGGRVIPITSGKCPNCKTRMEVSTESLYPTTCPKCGTKVNYKNIHHGC